MLATLVTLATLAARALSIPTIEAKGSKFFTSDGDQFYIKGVAYQLTDDDPLAQSAQCKLDAALMKTLGANTIRVYHVDPSADHDGCMQTFADAGIYAFIDLDDYPTYIMPQQGGPPKWTQFQYDGFQKVMDAFHTYDNVAGFFVANELRNAGNDSVGAPYIKAAARDMKSYRNSKGYREIPIGYSAADIADLRPNLQNYMACGSNKSESLDFFSLNAYEWCGDSSYSVSGYNMLEKNASDYNLPIFFSETGCNTPAPRTFDDQSAIFGNDMSGTWSGAIIYEWIQEANNYGLISYGSPAPSSASGTGVVGGYTRTGTPTPISPDFSNLSKQWATLSPSGVSANAYTPSMTPPACPAYTSSLWEVNGNVALPTLGQEFNAAVSRSITGGTADATGTASGGAASGTASGASGSGSAGAAAATSTAAAAPRETSVYIQAVAVAMGGMAVFAL